jgi:hypothetical protein
MADDTGIPKKPIVPAIEQPVAAIVIPALSIVAEVLQKISDDLPLVVPTSGTP